MSRWFANHRQEWIKATAERLGYINRCHITEKFDVSTPQASVDIQTVCKRWPKLLRYDKSAKRYVIATPGDHHD